MTIPGFLNVTECDTWLWAMRAGPGDVSEVPRGYLQLWPGRSWNRQKEIPLSHHGKWPDQWPSRRAEWAPDVSDLWWGPISPCQCRLWVMLMIRSHSLRAQTGELLAPCHHRGSLTADGRKMREMRDFFGSCRALSDSGALSAGWQQIRENKYQHLIFSIERWNSTSREWVWQKDLNSTLDDNVKLFRGLIVS